MPEAVESMLAEGSKRRAACAIGAASDTLSAASAGGCALLEGKP